LEGSPCSRTGEGGLCGEPFGDDTGGGTESDGDGGEIEVPLEDDEVPSLGRRARALNSPLIFHRG
jgi:hypothetical protein